MDPSVLSLSSPVPPTTMTHSRSHSNHQCHPQHQEHSRTHTFSHQSQQQSIPLSTPPAPLATSATPPPAPPPCSSINLLTQIPTLQISTASLENDSISNVSDCVSHNAHFSTFPFGVNSGQPPTVPDISPSFEKARAEIIEILTPPPQPTSTSQISASIPTVGHNLLSTSSNIGSNKQNHINYYEQINLPRLSELPHDLVQSKHNQEKAGCLAPTALPSVQPLVLKNNMQSQTEDIERQDSSKRLYLHQQHGKYHPHDQNVNERARNYSNEHRYSPDSRYDYPGEHCHTRSSHCNYPDERLQSRHFDYDNQNNSNQQKRGAYSLSLRKSSSTNTATTASTLSIPSPATPFFIKDEPKLTPLPETNHQQHNSKSTSLRSLSSPISKSSNKSLSSAGKPKGSTSRRGNACTTCPTCGKTYTESSNLSKHIRTVHLKLRPFQCTQCPARFAERNKLGKHVQSVHERARPFRCDQCGARFSQASDRKRHRLVLHEGRRPFVCNICGRAFGRRSSLTQHCARVHKLQPDEVNATSISSQIPVNKPTEMDREKLIPKATGSDFIPVNYNPSYNNCFDRLKRSHCQDQYSLSQRQEKSMVAPTEAQDGGSFVSQDPLDMKLAKLRDEPSFVNAPFTSSLVISPVSTTHLQTHTYQQPNSTHQGQQKRQQQYSGSLIPHRINFQ